MIKFHKIPKKHLKRGYIKNCDSHYTDFCCAILSGRKKDSRKRHYKRHLTTSMLCLGLHSTWTSNAKKKLLIIHSTAPWAMEITSNSGTCSISHCSMFYRWKKCYKRTDMSISSPFQPNDLCHGAIILYPKRCL